MKKKSKNEFIKEPLSSYFQQNILEKIDKQNDIENSEEFYTKIKMQHLILYGIYSIISNGETCTFERLVIECSKRFPKVFNFKRYPDLPDSLKFDRPLRTLREEGLIVGSVRDHFELTEFGKKIAEKTKDILERKMVFKNQKNRVKSRSVEDKLIDYIRESTLFKNFLTNPEGFNPSESEFKSFLRCTLETPERVIKQNLEYYKNVVKSYNEEEMLNFLLVCEKKFIKKREK